jgi:HD-GYP domain-containing protein (c-di-GMP phosphodiesterase class II)
LHPLIGRRLIEQVPALRPISPAVLHHHERFDGGGYPSGLRGEEIPLEARIICVIDCFSAIISERPYRGPMSIDEACAELERNAGTQFDPEVVRVFVEEVRRKPPILGRQDLAMTLRDKGSILGHDTLALIDNLTLL